MNWWSVDQLERGVAGDGNAVAALSAGDAHALAQLVEDGLDCVVEGSKSAPQTTSLWCK